MLVASAGLIPHQPAALLGLEVVVIGLVLLLTGLTLQIRSLVMVRGQPIKWWLPRLTISLVTVLPLVIGGLMLALGRHEGMVWVAAGVMLSLAAGVFNTWILLIEILRKRRPRPAASVHRRAVEMRI
jgi:hypothetical protein